MAVGKVSSYHFHQSPEDNSLQLLREGKALGISAKVLDPKSPEARKQLDAGTAKALSIRPGTGEDAQVVVDKAEFSKMIESAVLLDSRSRDMPSNVSEALDRVTDATKLAGLLTGSEALQHDWSEDLAQLEGLDPSARLRQALLIEESLQEGLDVLTEAGMEILPEDLVSQQEEAQRVVEEEIGRLNEDFSKLDPSDTGERAAIGRDAMEVLHVVGRYAKYRSTMDKAVPAWISRVQSELQQVVPTGRPTARRPEAQQAASVGKAMRAGTDEMLQQLKNRRKLASAGVSNQDVYLGPSAVFKRTTKTAGEEEAFISQFSAIFSSDTIVPQTAIAPTRPESLGVERLPSATKARSIDPAILSEVSSDEALTRLERDLGRAVEYARTAENYAKIVGKGYEVEDDGGSPLPFPEWAAGIRSGRIYDDSIIDGYTAYQQIEANTDIGRAINHDPMNPPEMGALYQKMEGGMAAEGLTGWQEDALRQLSYEKGRLHLNKAMEQFPEIDDGSGNKIPFAQFAEKIRRGELSDELIIDRTPIWEHLEVPTDIGRALMHDPKTPPAMGQLYLDLPGSTADSQQDLAAKDRICNQHKWHILADGDEDQPQPVGFNQALKALAEGKDIESVALDKDSTPSATLMEYALELAEAQKMQDAYRRCGEHSFEVQIDGKWQFAKLEEALMCRTLDIPIRDANSPDAPLDPDLVTDLDMLQSEAKWEYSPAELSWSTTPTSAGTVQSTKPMVHGMKTLWNLKDSGDLDSALDNLAGPSEEVKAVRTLYHQPMDFHGENIGAHTIPNPVLEQYEGIVFSFEGRSGSFSELREAQALRGEAGEMPVSWTKPKTDRNEPDVEHKGKLSDFPDLHDALSLPAEVTVLDFFDTDICFAEEGLPEHNGIHTAPIRHELLKTSFGSRAISEEALAAIEEDSAKTDEAVAYLQRADHPLKRKMSAENRATFQEHLNVRLENYSLGTPLMKPADHLSALKQGFARDLAAETESPIWAMIQDATNSDPDIREPEKKEERLKIAGSLFPRATLGQQQAFQNRMERQKAYLAAWRELEAFDLDNMDSVEEGFSKLEELMIGDHIPISDKEQDTLQHELEQAKRVPDEGAKKAALESIIDKFRERIRPTFRNLARTQYPVLNDTYELGALYAQRGQDPWESLPDFGLPIEKQLQWLAQNKRLTARNNEVCRKISGML